MMPTAEEHPELLRLQESPLHLLRRKEEEGKVSKSSLEGEFVSSRPDDGEAGRTLS